MTAAAPSPRTAFDFVRTADVHEDIARAANTIVASGLMRRDGKVTPGGNNVMAQSAARTMANDAGGLIASSGSLIEEPSNELLTQARLVSAYAAHAADPNRAPFSTVVAVYEEGVKENVFKPLYSVCVSRP